MTIKELKELLTQISDANPGFDDDDDMIDCISCGNANDVYDYGVDNGRGDLARELLEKLDA